ncbi:hypothetical protein ES703_96345 [subsurface metagenome]
MVPYPHFIHFINPVKLILDPGRLRPNYTTEPHIFIFCRVQVIGIQPRTVDGIFRPLICGVRAGSCSGDILTSNRISERLDGKLPHIAFEHRGIRWCTDLIDPPVVSLPKIETTERIGGLG